LKLKSSGICPLVSERVSDSEQALEAAAIDAKNAAKLLRSADRGALGRWRGASSFALTPATTPQFSFGLTNHFSSLRATVAKGGK
jgi:hypothetical protein